ncbi:MAG: ABC transporter permease [Candidatus Thorarchaeota archaeon]|jgi:peptide/nickel transport system permease protein
MTETSSQAWSDYQAVLEEKAVGLVKILGIVQAIVGLSGIGAALVIMASGILPYINLEMGLANALYIIVIHGIPVFLFGALLFNVGRAILTLDTWAFSWVMYGNLIVTVLYVLIGGWLPFLAIGNLLAFALLFSPGARAYWWQLLIRRSPLVVGGVIIIVGYVVIALTVHLWAPYGPTERIWTETLQAPSATHLWGTDQNGGDIFSMVMWATRIDLRIALSVVSVSLIIGTLVGAAAGYFGGAVDEIVMRITDVFFAFPGLILAMAIVAALGERSLDNIAIALMFVWWPTYARLVRGQVLIERERLYVEAARSVGASDFRILLSHILPNTVQPVIVQATLDLGGVLLTAAGLSFIGFGAEAGTAEWGLMIATGQDHFTFYWLVFYPGFAILLIALAFNLVGDGVRDILDPKLRRR